MPTHQKLAAVQRIVNEGQKVSDVARELKIARKTLYKWISLYKNSSGRQKLNALTPKYIKGRAHHKSAGSSIRSKLLRLIKKSPNLTISEIADTLKTGRHLVYSNLKSLNLSTIDTRLALAKSYKHPGIFEVEVKLSITRKAFSRQESISNLARNHSVSRKTIHKWLNSFQHGGSLKCKYKEGEDHPRAYKKETIDAILAAVIKSPELPIQSLAHSLKLGVHGVFNVLNRFGLTKKDARFAYAAARKEVSVTPVPQSTPSQSFLSDLTPNLLPAPPPSGFDFKLFAKTSIVSFSGVLLLAGLVSRTSAPNLGNIFAGIALTMGSIFFLYSLKYYLTLAAVLSYNRDAAVYPNGKSRGSGLLSLILGQNAQVNQAQKHTKSFGLESNLEDIKLKQKPFVSVHIPLYNEKNVARRAIESAINFRYPNYEIIVCDDSVDETTNIIKELQKSHLFKGEKLNVINNNHEGWSLSQVEVKPGVTLKHLHRKKRDGFKGKALELALTLVNPATEFISVFDADFVPYPDTLEMFLKYFQLADQNSKQDTNSNIAAVQGYQWHVLNKSENWITRGVRSDYAGSYVIERTGAEIYGGLKQISGSVYMIRRAPLEEVGWGSSITEDFQLTLKLYSRGYKVLYTPYIQAPSECVSTVKRIIRQRMRWAEGHSFNIKSMFGILMFGPHLTLPEKMELLYLAPYYLQAFFFLVGTFAWLISEVILGARLSFWTELWGWSLVLTNLISLPLVNAAGLFLEESEKKDYSGLWSFVVLSYVLVPFQAYASIKGLLEKEEGPWFRTPKTGRVTDFFRRGKFYRWLIDVVQRPGSSPVGNNLAVSFSQAKSPRHVRLFSKAALSLMLIIAIFLNYLSFFAPVSYAAAPDPTIEQQINIIDQEYSTTSTSDTPSDNSLGLILWDGAKYNGETVYFEAVIKCATCTGGNTAAAVTLYTDTGTAVTGGSVSTTSTTYTRVRTSAVTANLTNGEEYSVRIKVDATSGTAYVKAARLIIVQTDPTRITDTVNQIELGNSQNITSSSYGELTNPKYYYYDTAKFSGTETAYFESTLKGDSLAAQGDGRLWSSGFELNSASAGMEWENAGGSPSIQSTTARSGTYALQISSLASGTRKNLMHGYAAIASGPFYHRVYLRVGTMPSAENRIVSVNGSTSPGTQARVYVTLDNTGALRLYDEDGAIGSASSALSTDTWYRIEIETDRTAAAGSHVIRARLDGTEFAGSATRDISAGFLGIHLGGNLAQEAQTTGNWYFDDVAVNNSTGGYPGPGSIIHLNPNATGDNSDWTNDYTTMDELPPNDATDYISSSTLNQIEDVNLDNTPSGIATGDTVNVVNVGIRATADTTGANARYKMRIKASSGGTVEESAQITNNTTTWYTNINTIPRVYNLTLYDLPGASTTRWTKSDLDSSQIGVQLTVSNGVQQARVSSMWILVDYTPAADLAINAQAKLQQCDEGSCSWTDVSGSTLTSTSTSFARYRSSSLTLTNTRRYRIAVAESNSTGTAKIANAKLIIEQADAAGLTDIELVQEYVNTLVTDTDSTYTDQDYLNRYDPDNFYGGTFTKYFEATIKTSAGTGYAQLWNDTDGSAVTSSEVSTTSTSYTRVRSSDITANMPATAKNMDTQVKNSASDTTSVGSTWLIIQVSSLQIPENLMLFLPFIIFLPVFFRKRYNLGRMFNGK